MKFLLLVSLLTVVFLDHTLGCHRSRLGVRVGRSANYNEGDNGRYRRRSIIDSSFESDGEEYKDNIKVRKVLDQLYDAMWRPNNAEEIKHIDPKVAKFIKEKSSGQARAVDSSHNQLTGERCQGIIRAMHPREHYRHTRFVVHTVNFNQMSEISECIAILSNDGIECVCGEELSKRQCEQMHREVELLTLPTGKEEYDINDFEINKFIVPNGCTCTCQKN